ncbi:hypothetical protein, partial [uncultured Lamprocystis sp.]|uniref:hypothetical protein n=1 Tax=uncultured Lamprocystis sp. TaxID=543132 RepID=UPI0025D77DD5
HAHQSAGRRDHHGLANQLSGLPVDPASPAPCPRAMAVRDRVWRAQPAGGRRAEAIGTAALIIVPASRGTGRLESKASALDRQAKAEALDSK